MAVKTCKACGRRHVNKAGRETCSAHIRDTGAPCLSYAIKGTTVCYFHGGKSPLALQKIERTEALDDAVRVMKNFGVPVNIEPTQALLEEIRYTAGHVHFLRARIQELIDNSDDPNNPYRAIIWGTLEETDVQSSQFPGTDVKEGAGIHVWYQLYLQERKHLVAVSTAAIRAGIEERRVQVEEQQGLLFAGALRLILADLGLTTQQWELTKTVIPMRMRELDAR